MEVMLQNPQNLEQEPTLEFKSKNESDTQNQNEVETNTSVEKIQHDGEINKKDDYMKATTNTTAETLKSVFILPILKELDEKLLLAESSLTGFI